MRLIRLATLLCALTWLMTPSLSRADEPGRADEPSRAADTLTEYKFEEELITGDDANPSGEILHSRRRAARESLIRARSHFVDRLLKSIEAL